MAEIRPKCFLGQRCCLAPGIQERTQGFPVGDIYEQSPNPDPDLVLSGS
jgi:hypothetical protein